MLLLSFVTLDRETAILCDSHLDQGDALSPLYYLVAGLII
jgi:hypothetical protein